MPTNAAPSLLSSSPRIAWATSCSAALAAGLIWGLIEPRGPVSGVQAVAVMGTSVAIGWIGGQLTGARKAAILLPLAHVTGFELARRTSNLPTVAAFEPTSGFGLLAMVLGRIIPWLLAATPLAVGAVWGSRRTKARRPIALLACSAALVLLATWLAVPASPEPVRAPGGFADLVEVELGGHRQWIQVRGTDPANPVLLYLSGGPGQSDLAFSRVLLEPLLEEVTIVGWDQRGTGKSYPDLDEAGLTLDRAVSDVVELASHLTARFDQPRIYLLGESWGSLLGVLAVQRAPELFAAYIGSGQMVNVLDTDTTIYADLISTALRNGDGALLAELVELGRPPYPSVFDYGRIMTLYPLLEGGYTPPREYRERAAAGNVGPMGIGGIEYGPVEKLNVLRGLIDMFSVMYPQLQQIDLRQSAARLDVPVFILCGDHEIAARTGPARDWFDQLEAPGKQWLQLPDAGHSVAFEQVGTLRDILTTQAVPTRR
ncbi:MAG: alpha/beta hydrolase [Propionibacteriaceae bacterium]|nr:alpha/beta hydrolase [Propionibacteriaceae bacterium]